MMKKCLKCEELKKKINNRYSEIERVQIIIDFLSMEIRKIESADFLAKEGALSRADEFRRSLAKQIVLLEYLKKEQKS